MSIASFSYIEDSVFVPYYLSAPTLIFTFDWHDSWTENPMLMT